MLTVLKEALKEGLSTLKGSTLVLVVILIIAIVFVFDIFQGSQGQRHKDCKEQNKELKIEVVYWREKFLEERNLRYEEKEKSAGTIQDLKGSLDSVYQAIKKLEL